MQGIENSVVNCLEYYSFVCEFDLKLRGVNVNVHNGGIEDDIENANGEFLMGYSCGVGLLYRRHCRAALDKSAVYKEVFKVFV